MNSVLSEIGDALALFVFGDVLYSLFNPTNSRSDNSTMSRLHTKVKMERIKVIAFVVARVVFRHQYRVVRVNL